MPKNNDNIVRARRLVELACDNRPKDMVKYLFSLRHVSWVAIVRDADVDQTIILELLAPTAYSMHKSHELSTRQLNQLLAFYTRYALSLDSSDGEVSQMILRLADIDRQKAAQRAAI